MKYFLFITFVVVSMATLGLPQKNNSNPEKAYRFVCSLSAMHVTSREDAQAVSKILAEHIKKELQRSEKIEIIIIKNKNELIEELNNGYDLLVLSTEEYLSLHKQYNIIPTFINETKGNVGFNYLLVVNNDDQINDISQLKGTDIYIQAQGAQEAPELLINKLLKKLKLPGMDKFFSKITRLPTTNNVVLPVFFKKAKAAMVTEQSLKVLAEINPQIKNQLKVIYRSPALILGVSCFNEGTITPENRKLMTEILSTLNTDVYGKQLLNLFSTDRLVPFKEEYLKEYISIFER